MISNSRCSICNKEVTTGDFNGICQSCRSKEHHELNNTSPIITYASSTKIDKHEQARIDIQDLSIWYDHKPSCDRLRKYVSQCEATEKAYEELKRLLNDLRPEILASEKYMKSGFGWCSLEHFNVITLLEKLSKVGNDNEQV